MVRGVEAGQAGLGGGPGRWGQLPMEAGLGGAGSGELARWDGGSAAGGIFFHMCELRCLSSMELSAEQKRSSLRLNT